MFSEILVKLIEERNVTAYQVAKATGMSNTALSRYKAGKQAPAIDQLIAIADFFDVSTDYLLGRTDKPKNNDERRPNTMDYKGDCRKIVERVLMQAVMHGSYGASITADYESIAKELNLESENYCKICVQYLVFKNYLRLETDKDGSQYLSASESAIDFL